MLSSVNHVWRQFRNYLVTGAMVWVPLLATVWVTWLLVDRIGFGVERLFEDVFVRLGIKEYRRGVGLGLTLVIFLTTGLLARYIIGRKLIAAGERILNAIPFINRLYRAIQQIRDVFVTRKGTVFQQVCVVSYPRAGMWVVGFVTSDDQGLVQEAVGMELTAVFIPTTPNPTSGFLVYLPAEDIRILNMTVEEAMKLIISGGAYLPSRHRNELYRPEQPDQNKSAPSGGGA